MSSKTLVRDTCKDSSHTLGIGRDFVCRFFDYAKNTQSNVSFTTDARACFLEKVAPMLEEKGQWNISRPEAFCTLRSQGGGATSGNVNTPPKKMAGA